MYKIVINDSTCDGTTTSQFALQIEVNDLMICNFSGQYNDTQIDFPAGISLKDISSLVRNNSPSKWNLPILINLNTLFQNIVKSAFVIADWLSLYIQHPNSIDVTDLLQDEFIINNKEDTGSAPYIYFPLKNKYSPTDLIKLFQIGELCKSQLLLDNIIVFENFHTPLARQTMRVDTELGKLKEKILKDCENRMERWQNGAR